jgi:RimJ/RimL family protein N-acetyltransferase
VSLADTEQLIGFCGLRLMDGGPELELMYGLLPRYWGRGLVTEGAAAWLTVGFDTLQRPQLWALTDAPNQRSVAVMQRLGMRFSERVQQPSGIDAVRYVISREEWTNVRTDSVLRR